MPKPRISEGQQRYEDYWATQMEDPEFRALYEEEAAKKELWLQLAEACEAAGLSQAELAEKLGISEQEMAAIEERGYDILSVDQLRAYLAALAEVVHEHS